MIYNVSDQQLFLMKRTANYSAFKMFKSSDWLCLRTSLEEWALPPSLEEPGEYDTVNMLYLYSLIMHHDRNPFTSYYLPRGYSESSPRGKKNSSYSLRSLICFGIFLACGSIKCAEIVSPYSQAKQSKMWHRAPSKSAFDLHKETAGVSLKKQPDWIHNEFLQRHSLKVH